MKHLLLLLALGGLGASCSNDDLTDGSNPIAGRTELQIAFSGSGESQEYTRAIASENENMMGKLEVYLFAAASQGGPFYYLETWKEGIAFNSEVPTSTNFLKQASGTGWKATIYPGEQKGLPWIKLMCVANNGITGSATTDGQFYSEGGTTEVLAAANLTKVTVDADGIVTNAAAATTEEDFREAYTIALGNDAATGLIGHIDLPNKKITPLLMTGEGITKISGSVSKVDISLKRAMARFDIENNMATSSLTIEEVSLAHGRKSASLWGAAPTVVDQVDLGKSALLHTYPAVEFSKIPNANHGMLESAYYVYPGLATDESYLIVKGKYKSPVTSLPVEVTYNVPIVRTVEGAAQGEYIPLKANSRYRLRITDVSESNVFGSFEVVDWTSGGGIIIRPENDAPVFDFKDVFGTVEGEANQVPDTLLTSPLKNSYEVDGDAGAFTVKIAATGKVRTEKGDVAVRSAGNEWLNCTLVTSEERDGVYYSTFKIEYTGAIGQQPIALHFINESASFDPALWTTFNFYGPKAEPAFAVVAMGGSSKGNVTAVDAATKAPTASLYNLNGSFVKFNVTCLEGLAVDAAAAEGYEVIKEDSLGSVYTYKIAVSDATKANGGTIIFKNADDKTKETTLTLTKLEPGMVFGAGGGGGATWDVATSTLKIDLDALNSYFFKIEAPQGVGAPANLAACPWLTITETKAWNSTDGFAVYTITPKAPLGNTADFDLVFTDALTEGTIVAPSLTVTLKKDFSNPKFAATTDAVNGLNEAIIVASGAKTATGNMYRTNHSTNQLQVDVICPEEIVVTSTGGLTATKGIGNTYTITTDGTATAVGATATVTFANKDAATKEVVLTVTMVDPSMSIPKSTGTYLTLEDFVATIDVAGADDNGSTECGNLDILAPKGSKIAGDIPASDWVILTPIGGAGTTADHATSVKWKVSLKDAADRGSSTYADYRIVISNAATGTDEYITIKKKP